MEMQLEGLRFDTVVLIERNHTKLSSGFRKLAYRPAFHQWKTGKEQCIAVQDNLFKSDAFKTYGFNILFCEQI